MASYFFKQNFPHPTVLDISYSFRFYSSQLLFFLLYSFPILKGQMTESVKPRKAAVGIEYRSIWGCMSRHMLF